MTREDVFKATGPTSGAGIYGSLAMMEPLKTAVRR